MGRLRVKLIKWSTDSGATADFAVGLKEKSTEGRIGQSRLIEFRAVQYFTLEEVH